MLWRQHSVLGQSTPACAIIPPPQMLATIRARVVKLVDTGDLKSPGHCGRAGSIPAPGTSKLKF